MRLTALTLGFVAIAVSSVGAQPATRIRITGTQTLNLPGQLTIDRDRVSGTAIVGMDENVIRVKAPAGPGVWAIPRSGKRLTGMARAIEGDVLEFRRDGDATPLFVPFAAIQTVEISEGRRPNHGMALGILTGVGTFFGISGLTFANCGLGCSDGPFVAAIFAGVVGGAGLAHHLRREHWRTGTVDELAGLTKPAP